MHADSASISRNTARYPYWAMKFCTGSSPLVGCADGPRQAAPHDIIFYVIVEDNHASVRAAARTRLIRAL
jgi:hypothetical protein